MKNEQLISAKNAMAEWLLNDREFGKKPAQIECAKEFELHGLHYYIFKFKEKWLSEWKMGVSGGYEGNNLEHCGHVFSDGQKYCDTTAIAEATKIVEDIRTYWMEQAKKKADFDLKFKSNIEFRTQDEIPANEIESQFVRTESRYFLTVGEIDCPTGEIIVADPLAYLQDEAFSPVLDICILAGKYPVEVSIYRQDNIGIRMCTAKLKVKESRPLVYRKAKATKETVIQYGDEDMEGFPVDAGMITFCDAQIAQEYRAFLGKWYQTNPNGNHYDDYFASFFADSYKKLPAYQREGGDFMEWANPDTGNKMVMVASGFGDGFYNSYYGYDAENEVCEIIVPMVNPTIFSNINEE